MTGASLLLPTNAARFVTSLKMQLAGEKFPAILKREKRRFLYLLFYNKHSSYPFIVKRKYKYVPDVRRI